MTLRQVEHAKAACQHRQISVKNLAEDSEAEIRDILSWAIEMGDERRPLLIYTSETVEGLTKNRNELGLEKASSLCEHALAEIAAGLVKNGVTQLIVAGGETSGAVVKRLELDLLKIGPEIDPGVPWTLATGAGKRLALALKSGNFGSEDFFMKAWEVLS